MVITQNSDLVVGSSETQYCSVPNRGAGTFINFDGKFPNFPIAQPLSYSVLLMPARLFGPALVFGTLECVPRTIHKMVKPSRNSTFIIKGGLFSEGTFKLVLSSKKCDITFPKTITIFENFSIGWKGEICIFLRMGYKL